MSYDILTHITTLNTVCLITNVNCVFILGPVGMCANGFVRIVVHRVWAEPEWEGDVADRRVILQVLDFRLSHECFDFDSIFKQVEWDVF